MRLTMLYVGTEEDILAELVWVDSPVVRVADVDGALRYLHQYGGSGEQFLIAYGPDATKAAVDTSEPYPLRAWGQSIVLTTTEPDADIWIGKDWLGAEHVFELPDAWPFVVTALDDLPGIPHGYCLN